MTPGNNCQASQAEVLGLESSESMKILSDDAGPCNDIVKETELPWCLLKQLESMASF